MLNKTCKYFYLLFIISSITHSQIQKPSWVQSKPISNLYYIGIGSANKDTSNGDHFKIARNDALSDLSAEIISNIYNSTERTIIEKSGILEEDYKSFTIATTKSALEGYELIDNWESETEYWVYYQLSKERYERKRKEKLNAAKKLCLDMIRNADIAVRDHRISEGLILYINALKVIENYFDDPLETFYEGKDIYLGNHIVLSIQKLLNGIVLKPTEENVKLKINDLGNTKVKIFAYNIDINDSNTISDLPIKFEFVNGTGQLIENNHTNENGIAISNLFSLSGDIDHFLIKAKIDLLSYVNQDNSSTLLINLVNNFTVPYCLINIELKNLIIYVESSEVNINQDLNIRFLEPEIKNSLAEVGYEFVDTRSDADYLFDINAKSRKGSEIQGLYSAFLDLNISIIDLSSGLEQYKLSKNNIKGIHLDYLKAGLKAFEVAADYINTKMLPEILRIIDTN